MAENVFPIPQTPPIPTQKKASALKSTPLKTANANDVSTSGTTTKPKYKFEFNERIPASLLTAGLGWEIPIYAEGRTSGYSEFQYFYLWKYDGEAYENYRYLIFGYDDFSGDYTYDASTDEFVLNTQRYGDHRTILVLEDLDAETIAQLSTLGTLTPIGEPKYHFMWNDGLPSFSLDSLEVVSSGSNYYMTADRFYSESELTINCVKYDSLFVYGEDWQDQSYRDIYIYTDLTSGQIADMEDFGKFLSIDTKTVTATYNNQQLFSVEMFTPVHVTYFSSTYDIAILNEGDTKTLDILGPDNEPKILATPIVIGGKTIPDVDALGRKWVLEHNLEVEVRGG